MRSILIAIICAGSLCAAPFSVERYLEASEKCGSGAQYELALHYMAAGNPEESVKWLKQSADAENVDAMFLMGLCAGMGYGMPEDARAAVTRFISASWKGDAVAMFMVGKCFDGQFLGLTRDPDEAKNWYDQSAKAGYAPAADGAARMRPPPMPGVPYAASDYPRQTVTNRRPLTAEERIALTNRLATANREPSTNRLGRAKRLPGIMREDITNRVMFSSRPPAFSYTGITPVARALNALRDAESSPADVALLFRKSAETDTIETFETEKALAEQGAAENQYRVGEFYRKGTVVPHDSLEAQVWFRKAAEQGNASAQRALGLSLLYGDAGEQNTPDALVWLKKAAEQGDVLAQYTLGRCYIWCNCCGRRPPDTKANSKEALKWARMAAEQGYVPAFDLMGHLTRETDEEKEWYRKSAEGGDPEWQYYISGYIEDDFETKIKWLRLAAAQGHAGAMRELSSKCRQTEHNGSMTPPTDESRRWLRMAAELGNGFAQYQLGRDYRENGDFGEARKWLLSAAKKGDRYAMYELGLWYERGDTQRYGDALEQNFAEAFKWFEQSANDQNPTSDAQFRLARYYAGGIGVGKDPVKALEWYRLAANNNEVEAAYELGVIYAKGVLAPKDPVEAVKWYRLAAKRDHPRALYRLGMCYANGFGVPQNMVTAEKHFKDIYDKTSVAEAIAREDADSPVEPKGVTFKEAFARYLKDAAAGNAEAQYTVGFYYQNDPGIRDYEQAFTWYLKAAEQGEPRAQSALAACYAEGIGVSANRKEAKKWREKAQFHGLVRYSPKGRLGFDEPMTPEQVVSAMVEDLRDRNGSSCRRVIQNGIYCPISMSVEGYALALNRNTTLLAERAAIGKCAAASRKMIRWSSSSDADEERAKQFGEQWRLAGFKFAWIPALQLLAEKKQVPVEWGDYLSNASFFSVESEQDDEEGAVFVSFLATPLARSVTSWMTVSPSLDAAIALFRSELTPGVLGMEGRYQLVVREGNALKPYRITYATELIRSDRQGKTTPEEKQRALDEAQKKVKALVEKSLPPAFSSELRAISQPVADAEPLVQVWADDADRWAYATIVTGCGIVIPDRKENAK